MANTQIQSLRAELTLTNNQFRSEMRNIREALNGMRRDTQRVADEVDDMRSSMEGATEGISSMGGPISDVSDRIQSMTSFLTEGSVAWKVFGAGAASIGLILGLAADKFDDAQERLLKLQAVVRATGAVAGFSAEQLNAQARELSSSTLLNIDEIIEAQSLLMTIGSVTGDNFKQLISLSNDLASAGIGDLIGNVEQLAVSLQDPENELQSLAGTGYMTESQMIELQEAFRKTGDQSKLVSDVIKLLDDRVGGLGESLAGGSVGATKSLSESWDELLESIGKTTSVGKIVDSTIESLTNNLVRLRNQIDPSISFLTSEIERLQTIMNEGQTGGGRSASSARSTISRRIEEMRNQIVQLKSEEGDLQSTQQLLEGINKQLNELPQPETQQRPNRRRRSIALDKDSPAEIRRKELIEEKKILENRIAEIQALDKQSKESQAKLDKEALLARQKLRDDEFDNIKGDFDNIQKAYEESNNRILELNSASIDQRIEQQRKLVINENQIQLDQLAKRKEDLQNFGALSVEQEAAFAQARKQLGLQLSNDLKAIELQSLQERKDLQQESLRAEQQLDQIRIDTLKSRLDLLGDGPEAADTQSEIAVREAELQRDRQIQELESLREHLEQKKLLTEEMEKRISDSVALIKEQQSNKELAIAKKSTDEKRQLDANLLEARASIAQSFIEFGQQMSSEGSRSQKEFFKIQQGVSLGIAVMKLHEAISNASAQSTIYDRAAHIAAAAQIGLRAIAGIRSANIAHGGLEEVRRETTIYADKGERILSPRQNAKLEDYLDSQLSGGMSQGYNVTVNNYSNQNVDVQQDRENLTIVIGQVRQELMNDVQSGRGLGASIERSYNVSRRGI